MFLRSLDDVYPTWNSHHETRPASSPHVNAKDRLRCSLLSPAYNSKDDIVNNPYNKEICTFITTLTF